MPESAAMTTVMTVPVTPADQSNTTTKLRVPREDQSLYAVPALENAERLAQNNNDSLSAANVDIQGRSLSALRKWARTEMCRAARDYTRTWCDVPGCDASTEMVYVTGHQPLLFHPGVWVKNFALGRMARHPRAIGINLVVDNDTFSTASLRVPVGDRNQPSGQSIEFDVGQPARPWEGANILSPETFASFGDRISAAMANWGIDPIIRDLWPIVVERARESNGIADCLTAGRNQLERQWGTENLELPLSRLCTLDPFLWFFSHIVAHLPQFHGIYNTALAEYRQVNKIRSHTHPVPELRAEAGWLEAPFWIWSDEDYERRHVYCQRDGNNVLLQDGESVFATLPLPTGGEACCAVEELRKLPERGLHLRTRALTTTLFTRLCFADLFLHGIGGAKYDEMTDRIISRFFGLTPPSFMTVSATVLLPLQAHKVEPDDLIRLDVLERDLTCNPDRHLSSDDAAACQELIAEKQRLSVEAALEKNTESTRSERRTGRQTRYSRYRRYRAINEQLAAYVSAQHTSLHAERELLSHQLEANKILTSREFSFALYPEEKLKPFMQAASTASP